MKDNFDLYTWNKNRYLNKENTIKEVSNKDFDLREWNKKRYLGELDIDGGETNVDSVNITRGGDDAKMGAEEESDANVVGEGLNDRISKISIDYTEQGKLYKIKVTAKGKEHRLYPDAFNGLLVMLDIDNDIPLRVEEKVLDSIVNQLQDQGIDAEWNDYIDVS